MSKSHRIKILTKRMVVLRCRRVKPSDIACELFCSDKLFGYHVYENIVHKAEREALLRIEGKFINK